MLVMLFIFHYFACIFKCDWHISELILLEKEKSFLVFYCVE